jgi:hypothetical protein
MVSDIDLYELANQVFEELCLRENGFYHEEIYMNLEYMMGQPADEIKKRLEEMDAIIVSPPVNVGAVEIGWW